MKNDANSALELAVLFADFIGVVDKQVSFLKSFVVDDSLKMTFVRTGISQVRIGALALKESIRRNYSEYAPAKQLLNYLGLRMQELEEAARPYS